MTRNKDPLEQCGEELAKGMREMASEHRRMVVRLEAAKAHEADLTKKRERLASELKKATATVQRLHKETSKADRELGKTQDRYLRIVESTEQLLAAVMGGVGTVQSWAEVVQPQAEEDSYGNISLEISEEISEETSKEISEENGIATKCDTGIIDGERDSPPNPPNSLLEISEDPPVCHSESDL